MVTVGWTEELFFVLELVELVIKPASSDKLCMCASFADFSFVDNDDLVGIEDGR